MKIFEQLVKRLDAAVAVLGLKRKPVFVRVIRSDGREEILRDVDRDQPHHRVTIRFVLPKPVVEDDAKINDRTH